jgi:putative endonuclease
LYRVSQHRLGTHEGFTRKYGLKTLIWFETHGDVREAIHREKLIKRWRRPWKFDLIEAANPQWRDLWPELTGEHLTPLI